jgi:hypothetical protein
MLLIGPCSGFMSFKPLYAQIELACAGAPVRTPEPENATPGVPGGPVTSPAEATPALAPTIATEQAAAATHDPVRMTPSFAGQRLLLGAERATQKYARTAVWLLARSRCRGACRSWEPASGLPGRIRVR